MKKRTFLKLTSGAIAAGILSPMAALAGDDPLKNWAGNLVYGTRNLVNLQHEVDLPALLKKYPKLKVLGTRHCFNNIADSKNQFISLVQMDEPIVIDKAASRVTVGAGVRYGQLAEYLEKNGFALHNLASLPHISVAGACITATHGSGVKNKNLSGAVAALEFMDANGNTIRLSRDNDGERFYGAVVNLGAIGVLLKLELEIQPTYQVRQDVYENLSFRELEHHFDQIMSSGYSVSLFTDWRNKNCSEVWVKRRVEPGISMSVNPNFFGAKPATRNLHPIISLSAENCTEQMGVPGPWHERLPHFRMGFTPSSGKELQAEYFVPREHSFKAIMAVEKLHEQISPHLMITEIRTIDADQFWMSPCYKQPSTAIHFTWKQDWPAVKKLLPQIEAQLWQFGVKPHWGKLFTIAPAKLQQRYPQLPEFLKLAAEFDPEGKFRNDFLNENIFSA